MKKICGIYLIKNNKNGKMYFGQSVNSMKRIYNHRYLLNRDKHPNRHLQDAWNIYGESNFSMSIIQEAERWELDDLEDQYISQHKTLLPKFGYNMTSGGNAYKEIRPESIRKMSKSHLGVKLSEITKKKMSESRTGMKCPKSDSHRAKISHALLGRQISKDAVEKIRVAVMNRPKKKGCTSIFRGVSITKSGKWHSRVVVNRKIILLGNHETEVKAALAYNRYIIENNFPHPLNVIGA